MNNDIDGLEWLREIRRNIARECNNDPEKMGDYYRNIQRRYFNKMLKISEMNNGNMISKSEEKIIEPD